EGSNRAAAAMLAGAALAPSIAAVEGLLRRALGLVPASFVAVFADVAVVLGLLWGTGQRPDSMAVFAFALPLIEAGVRHGIRGVVATWLAVAFLVAGWTALEWDDLSLTARDPLTVTGLLLLTAVPAAHMADHLVERVEQYAHAHAGAEHRSAL